jgi:hypothetical protein
MSYPKDPGRVPASPSECGRPGNLSGTCKAAWVDPAVWFSHLKSLMLLPVPASPPNRRPCGIFSGQGLAADSFDGLGEVSCARDRLHFFTCPRRHNSLFGEGTAATSKCRSTTGDSQLLAAASLTLRLSSEHQWREVRQIVSSGR